MKKKLKKFRNSMNQKKLFELERVSTEWPKDKRKHKQPLINKKLNQP